MDFAQPVSFKNADIGRCAHQKRPEEEDGAVTAETVIQPEPVPTPAVPAPTQMPLPTLEGRLSYQSLTSVTTFFFTATTG